MTTENGMNANLAKTLIKNYTDNHLAVINASEQLTELRQPNATSDSRCIWFGINDLKSFISQIENDAQSKCASVTGLLGIRFYYCEYPAANSTLWGTPGLPMSEAQYAGMHTVMMVPTYNNGTNNVDFDPNYATPEGIPIPLTTVYSTITPATTLLMKNHGDVVPPPFTGATLGPSTGAYMLDIADAPSKP